MSVAMTHPSSNLFRRLSAFRERHGTKGAIFKSLDVLLHKFLRTSVHTVVWLDVESLGEMATPDPKFSFRFLTADEVEKYQEDPIHYIHPALAGGVRDGSQVCFAALEGERLAAFGCYSLNYVNANQNAGAPMALPPDVAYMSYGNTHPDYRGARLHGLVMGKALQELAKQGVTKLISIVAWTNWASLNSCERLGYECLGKMITIGGSNHAVGFYPTAAKQRGVQFGFQATRSLSQRYQRTATTEA